MFADKTQVNTTYMRQTIETFYPGQFIKLFDLKKLRFSCVMDLAVEFVTATVIAEITQPI